MTLNELSYTIIGKAIEVHSILGPGLLESAYQECLLYELKKEGLSVEKEKYLPLEYKELKLHQGYRLDLLVNNQIVVELKCVEKLTPVHTAQVLTYIRLGHYKLGLLINFNTQILTQGIKRFIN